MKTTLSITKEFTFEAAHWLPDHQGSCNRPHGHSYILEIEVEGETRREGPAKGMVMDFGMLKKAVTEDRSISTVQPSFSWKIMPRTGKWSAPISLYMIFIW